MTGVVGSEFGFELKVQVVVLQEGRSAIDIEQNITTQSTRLLLSLWRFN